MPKAKPKVTRECLVCSSEFLGTPAATRCDLCKSAGLKVPRASQIAHRKTAQPKQAKADAPLFDITCSACLTEFTTHKPKAARCPSCIEVGRQTSKTGAPAVLRGPRGPKKPPKPPIEKTCSACFSSFTTHKKKAARCDPCITEDRPVHRKACFECGEIFKQTDPHEINCPTCVETYGLDPFDLSPEQLERQAAENRRDRIRRTLDEHSEFLKVRAKPPKGPRMSRQTASTPIGILWRQLCAADGAASSLMYAGTTSGLTEDDKLALLTTFYRLRIKGSHPDALSHLCPEALLREEAQAAIPELPEVLEETGDDDDTFDPFHDLDPEMRQEMIDLSETQQRRTEALTLGLA